jgi:3-phenylpropionate/cinnamic acid dioxygenase small subunit
MPALKHEAYVIDSYNWQGWVQHHVRCVCGWVGPYRRNESEARADRETHLRRMS